MKKQSLTYSVRELIIDFILKEHPQYEWFEWKENRERDNVFALAVKLHGKLQGVEWQIHNKCNTAIIQIILSVEQFDILKQSKYITVDIELWKLIPSDAHCWNEFKKDAEKDYIALN